MAGPGTVLVYGKSGIGKTLDAHHTFRRAFTLLTERGGLDSVESHLGFVPDSVEVVSVDRPYEEALEAIKRRVAPAAAHGKYSAVIIDTLSELGDRLLLPAMIKWKGNTMKVYPEVGMQLKELVRRILAMGLWVVALCHEREPVRYEGRFTRGGPKLPGRLVEDIPALFSLILRADFGADDRGELTRVYRCSPIDATWIVKDRYGCAREVQPLDLRPLVWRITHPNQAEPEWPAKNMRSV